MFSHRIQDLLRAAAAGLAGLADQADDWETGIDPDWAAQPVRGVDFVGIDFSTSIQPIADHVIRGWDRYRAQMDALRPDHGVWAFGVNAVPFPLTRRPVAPARLPLFCREHFQRRGAGRGFVEYGSAFYDYLRVALEYAQELADVSVPVTVALLCDGFSNGGVYRVEDVRPLVEAARARGVRFRLVTFVRHRHWCAMWQFAESLGLTRADLEVVTYDGAVPDGHTMDQSFASLSRFG
jgi:hypothetical protein